MASDYDFINSLLRQQELSTDNRPFRLVLAHPKRATDNLLLPQSVDGREAICDGFTYRVNCIATDAYLPLKEFIGLPARLEFVTDRGATRQVSGLVEQVRSGDSDGAIASYQLVIRDAFSLMDKRINTRVFRRMNEREIVETMLREWQANNSVLAAAFDFEFFDADIVNALPTREQIWQFNESDSAFLRRILARSGISWFFRPGRSRQGGRSEPDNSYPAHTLVLFSRTESLKTNAAGTVRYHRQDAAEHRDAITGWSAVRTLQAGSTTRFSWDYKQCNTNSGVLAEVPGIADQGGQGNTFSAGLNEYIVDSPHVAGDSTGLVRLGALRMKRLELDTKYFYGEGGIRDFCAGEYFILTRHLEIDLHPPAEREFVIVALEVTARNNLPNGLEARVERLFRASQFIAPVMHEAPDADEDNVMRYRVRFNAIRRTVPLAPSYNPIDDVRDPGLQLAIVAGPKGEHVHCDELGRVKIRFPYARAEDHRVSGASDTDDDSAWVRVAMNWAGSGLSGCGAVSLPRVGTEVLVAFLGGDPDKPIIVGQLYNAIANPAHLSDWGQVPGTRYLSGMRSQEIRGSRANRLVFDDTQGQINAQLASDEGATQLNLGWLVQPRGHQQSGARGEGVEIRTDKSVAIRGAKGVLVTACGNSSVDGKQLDRNELIGLADGLHDIATQLSKLAEEHSKDPALGPELGELVDRLKNLHHGSNVAPSGTEGGAPIVAVSGPAGIVLASQQNLALGAEKNVDLITAGDTHMTAAGMTTMRAAKGMSLFANENGVKAIAARGKVEVQAQDDQLELLANKVLEIISTTDWINIKARQGVRIYGGGSELQISAEGIIGKTTGNNHFYAADHQTFAKQACQAEFPGELPKHDVCIPCMRLAARKHSPLVDPE